MSVTSMSVTQQNQDNVFSLTQPTSSLWEKQLVASWLVERLLGTGEGKATVHQQDDIKSCYVHIITHRILSEDELSQFTFLMGAMTGTSGTVSQTYIDPQVAYRDYSTILDNVPDPTHIHSIKKCHGKFIIGAPSASAVELPAQWTERQIASRIVFEEKNVSPLTFENAGIQICLPERSEGPRKITDNTTSSVLRLLRELSDNYESALYPESCEAAEVARTVRRVLSEIDDTEATITVSPFEQVICTLKAPFEYVFHSNFKKTLETLTATLSPEEAALVQLTLDPAYNDLYNIVADELKSDFQWNITAFPNARTITLSVHSAELSQDSDPSSNFLLKNLTRRIEWRSGYSVNVHITGEAPHLTTPGLLNDPLTYEKASAYATEFESAARRVLGKCVVSLEGNRIILSGLPSTIERNRSALLELSENAPVFVEVRRAQPKSIRYTEDEALTELHSIAREFPLIDANIATLKNGTIELRYYNPVEDYQSTWYERLETRLKELTTFLDSPQNIRLVHAVGEECLAMATAKLAKTNDWEIRYDTANFHATIVVSPNAITKKTFVEELRQLTGWRINVESPKPLEPLKTGEYYFEAPHPMRETSARQIERFLHTAVAEVCEELHASYIYNGSSVTIRYPWFDLPRTALTEFENRFSTAPLSVKLVPHPEVQSNIANLQKITRLVVSEDTEILHFGGNENGCYTVGVSGRDDLKEIRNEISRCFRETVEVYDVPERHAITTWLRDRSPGTRSVLWPLIDRMGTITASSRHLETLRDHMHGDRSDANKFLRNPSAPRKDHTDKYCLTLDPPHTVIRDDAYSIEDLGNDRLRIGIHIADATEICAPGSSLDWQAFRRFENVYSGPDLKRMLPREVAQLASLDPGKDRAAWSTYLTIDSSGNLLERSFERTIIKSRAALSIDDLSKLSYDSNGIGTIARNIQKAASSIKLGAILPEPLREVLNPLAVLKLAAERELAKHAYELKIPMFTFSPPMLSVADKHQFVSTVRSLVSMKNVGSLYASAEDATWPELRRQSLRLAERLRQDGNTGAAGAIVELIESHARDEGILDPASGAPLGEGVFTRIAAGLRNYSFLVNQRQLASAFGVEQRLSPQSLSTIRNGFDGQNAHKTTEEDVALISKIRNNLPSAAFKAAALIHSLDEKSMIVTTLTHNDPIYIPIPDGHVPEPIGAQVAIHVNGYNVLYKMRVGYIEPTSQL